MDTITRPTGIAGSCRMVGIGGDPSVVSEVTTEEDSMALLVAFHQGRRLLLHLQVRCIQD